MKQLFVALVLVATVLHASQSHPDSFKSRFRNGPAFQEAVNANLHTTRQGLNVARHSTVWSGPNMTASYWSALVNSTNPTSTATFQQRYFQDTTYASSDVNTAFLYIAGEGPVTSSMTGQPLVMAQNMSARLVTLEHRFYGESMPSPWTDKEGLKYLTVDYAMADFNAFTSWYETKVAGKPLNWVVVGGSYAGGLSAWLRTTYPDTFVASWSSSGVVNPIFNFYHYDNHIKHVIDPSCVRAVQNIEAVVTQMWTSGQADVVRSVFNISEGWMTLQEVQYMLADSSAGAVQYGMKDRMCNAIQPVDAANPLAQYANMITAIWGTAFSSSCGYSTQCLTNAANFANGNWASADYPWMYQVCSELGWFQIGYPGGIRPENVSTTYYIDQCKAMFNGDIFPDTYSYDLLHGGANPTTKGATRVIALQGSDDPWQTAGVRKTLSEDYVEVTAQCTGCGHCGDLFVSTRPSIMHQHEVTWALLSKWVREASKEKRQSK